MEDAIFKGSGSRRQLGMAEVTLTIDNESGVLPLNIPEITITRRLFRSGESEYLINRKTCRLADINEMFMDTGMGTDSYSMFEQGMINAILSDKTEDRRHIFEEAAGVTKYKARRKTALQKLAGIEDDLNRVSDIITELERHVNSLHRQAARAARYRTLKKEVRAHTLRIAAHETASLTHTLKVLDSDIEVARNSEESLNVRIAEVNERLESLAVDLIDSEKDRQDAAAAYEDVRNTAAEREKEQARTSSRLEYLAERMERTAGEEHQARELLEDVTQRSTDMERDLSAVNGRLEAIKEQTLSAVGEYREFEDRVREHEQVYEELGRQVRSREQELGEIQTQIGIMETKLDNAEKRRLDLHRRAEELAASIKIWRGEHEKHQTKRQELKNLLEAAETEISGLRENHERKLAERESLDERLRTLREREAALNAEHEFIDRLIRTSEGYGDGVRHAVGSPRISDGILGVLGDVIATDDKYIPAIGTALGKRIELILVDSEDRAAEGVGLMAGDDAGRAGFTTLNGLRAGAGLADIPNTPGVLGRAADFVRTEARFKPIVDRLLGSVAVVETFAHARDLHRWHEDLTFVTLNGEIVTPLGDMYGGGDRENAVIGRTERRDRLAEELAGTRADIETATDERETLTKDADYLQALMRERTSERTLNAASFSELNEQQASLTARLTSAQEQLRRLAAEREEIDRTLSTNRENRERLCRERDILRDQIGSLRSRMEDSAEDLTAMRQQRERRQAEVNAVTVDHAALTEKQASLKRELTAMKERAEALRETIALRIKEREETDRERQTLRKDLEVIARDLEQLAFTHDTHKTRRDEINHAYADLSSRRSELERSLHDLRRNQLEHTKKASALTIQHEEAELRKNNIIERLQDDFYVTVNDLPSIDEDNDYNAETIRGLLEDARRKIQYIGDVNLTAETEYEEEKKRLDFLTGERDDLTEAHKAMVETITRINSIARDRFAETFERIRINFQKTFAEFFDGGICDLDLEEDTDPLEAKIQITARPPGKNIRSIGLLSSGERALTAISLLFAIYQVKPSPFCILDEVDAPLDDANIDRYLDVIRTFSQSTQFIMVTHNKKTMSAADNLYGITMSEPGLSSLVSVRLSEVDSFRENRPEKEVQQAVAKE